MAPFDLSGDHQPYQGEWDQWWLGRPGEEFDVLPRGLLDFTGMRTRAAQLAATLDHYHASRIPYRQRQPEWAIPTEHLLTLDGAWTYVNATRTGNSSPLDFANGYLDGLAPDIMIIRLRIHC
ncbi:hypothetical protein ACFRCI_32560 [Streptomyces sp. NPDC056638]|uniref:hypothetical protein n=1 Tax=Streptomyces sp. NPDC056638 TaxID=3345887 RepID=UPI00369AF6D6